MYSSYNLSLANECIKDLKEFRDIIPPSNYELYLAINKAIDEIQSYINSLPVYPDPMTDLTMPSMSDEEYMSDEYWGEE